MGNLTDMIRRWSANELPRSKLPGYQNIAMRIYPKGPECFNRGSTMLLTTTLSHVEWVGGPVPVSPGFPTVREPHRPEGNRGIEAFGNDGL
jgi:hypothetical protein